MLHAFRRQPVCLAPGREPRMGVRVVAGLFLGRLIDRLKSASVHGGAAIVADRCQADQNQVNHEPSPIVAFHGRVKGDHHDRLL